MDVKTLAISDPQDYLQGIGFESLPQPKNILFFRRESKQSLQQNSIENKSHHRIVIVINFETKGYVHLDHLEVNLEPNQVLVIHPHQFHHFSNLESSRLNWLICTFELYSTSYIESLRNKKVNLTEDTLSCLQAVFSAFTRSQTEELAADELQAQLLTFLIKIKQDQASRTEKYSVINNDIVSRVNRVLIDSKNIDLSVGFVADKLSLSESRLRAVFKEGAGVSLGRYINNYKIHISLSLLQDVTLSVSDVADQSGFASLQAFSRAFKQNTGKSPRFYRAEAIR